MFPFIERCKISLNYLEDSGPSLAACNYLEFMERVRTVMLQHVAQLINIGRTHILYDHEVFKTELFLNYRETMGNFFSSSMNPVFQALNVVLQKLSSQLTNLYSDVNGNQKSSIYFMSSNFRQINYNVGTVKMMLLVLQLSVICKFCFDYFSLFDRCSNSSEPLSDKIIITSDQVVNSNSYETSNLDNKTNTVPPQDSND